jgi:hypothetical protein
LFTVDAPSQGIVPTDVLRYNIEGLSTSGPQYGPLLEYLVAPLGEGGALAIFCGQSAGTVHVIVDVNGYFE